MEFILFLQRFQTLHCINTQAHINSTVAPAERPFMELEPHRHRGKVSQFGQ